MTISRRVKPDGQRAAGGTPPALPRPRPRAPRRPRRPPGGAARARGPAEVAAGASPPPPVCAGLFIFGGHPEALQGVGLGARAVLPGDVDLEVAERVVGLEVERLVAQALVPPGVANQDVGAEALGAVAVRAVVLDLRAGDQRVHGRAGRQHGTGLTAGSLLHAEARAEDLEAGDDPHPEDRERDRDLDEREANSPGGPSSARPLRGLRASDAPGPRRPARALSRSASLAPGGRSRAAAFLPAPHGVASPTWIVPRSGSSTTLRRCSLRSRRPDMITSAPLVLPFGKKSICTTPSLKAWPPRTSSMTARSVSTAQRPQPVVWMLFSRASMTSPCGWPRATASPRQ